MRIQVRQGIAERVEHGDDEHPAMRIAVKQLRLERELYVRDARLRAPVEVNPPERVLRVHQRDLVLAERVPVDPQSPTRVHNLKRERPNVPHLELLDATSRDGTGRLDVDR